MLKLLTFLGVLYLVFSLSPLKTVVSNCIDSFCIERVKDIKSNKTYEEKNYPRAVQRKW